ncbi:hypothetical protein LVD15_12945 [Fulvivirga maritima]|uniref:hypothetical protein n=1 Tax=Fulvivirga maritima TaxID=2904247 RepID=UPI001F281D90|nr:hypothetical protein [Fulvivirga maritima]UII29292.1 hypothetical protein LVD15_12945 [Fulvivirga maritima]
MNWKNVLLTGIILILSFPAISQNRLIIAKKGMPPKYSFWPGDEIRLKLIGDSYWSTGTIEALGDGYVKLHDTKIALAEIEKIDIRSKRKSTLVSTVTAIVAIGAVGFPAVDTLNGVIVNGESVDTKSLKIGAYLAAGALTLYFLQRKNVKIGKKFKLRVGEI